MAAMFLTAAMLARESLATIVWMVLIAGLHSEKVYVRYGLRKPRGYYSSEVARMPLGGSPFEIPLPTDRFKALAWAPG